MSINNPPKFTNVHHPPKNRPTRNAVNVVKASRSPRRGERQQFLGRAGLSDAVAKGPAALGGSGDGGDGAEAR